MQGLDIFILKKISSLRPGVTVVPLRLFYICAIHPYTNVHTLYTSVHKDIITMSGRYIYRHIPYYLHRQILQSWEPRNSTAARDIIAGTWVSSSVSSSFFPLSYFLPSPPPLPSCFPLLPSCNLCFSLSLSLNNSLFYITVIKSFSHPSTLLGVQTYNICQHLFASILVTGNTSILNASTWYMMLLIWCGFW